MLVMNRLRGNPKMGRLVRRVFTGFAHHNNECPRHKRDQLKAFQLRGVSVPSIGLYQLFRIFCVTAIMGLLTLATSLLALGSTATAANLSQRSNNHKLTAPAQSLFDYSMQVSDSRFDASYGYVWYQDNGQWSVRFTAWYIAGLLHRAKGDDVKTAVKAIENV